MTILAIDPGTTESGWCILHDGAVIDSGVTPNEVLLVTLRLNCYHSVLTEGKTLAIEMIACYGMAVGKEVFETCVWIGRFQQTWYDPGAVLKVYRSQVKQHLCHSAKAKDTNIRQALIDKLGAPGTKKAPGPTYGVSSHAWAALAVAVTADETMIRPAHEAAA